MFKVGWIIGVAGIVAGLAVPASAQLISPVEEVIPPSSETATDGPSRNDPFGLEGIAETKPDIAPPPAGFLPAEKRPPRMPQMTLRGIGRMNTDDLPTALLEIEGFGLFIVTENDTISLQGVAGDNVMRIVNINDISVTVEAGSFGELIVVR